MTLPALPSLQTIIQRLPMIFPEGTDNRTYVVREQAARTIYTMFYVGAVEGYDRWLRPNQVTRMTDAQLTRTVNEQREEWVAESLRPQRGVIPDRWYADTTREPIRDETLKEGLLSVGAVVSRPNEATSSARPRWALEAAFAELFLVSNEEFAAKLEAWRESHLTAGALARIRLLQSGLTANVEYGVDIKFPSGEIRRMAPGPSSIITKRVIEEFALRFLREPGVLWVSESANKIVQRDDDLAKAVGLNIDASKVLPDIILVDLGVKPGVLFVFVEVVATDGPITTQRRQELENVITEAGHDPRSAAYVTAFLDRSRAYPSVSKRIAWDSFVWYASEPDKIIHRRSGTGRYLADLLGC